MNQTEEKKDYRSTMSLPGTDFPMKAGLRETEPRIMRQWEEQNIEAKIADQSADRPKYVLHDGPPYANGDIHMGHALNKILKDVIVRLKRMDGFNSPYVPGWDCHGLPIEAAVLKELGKEMHDKSPLEIRKLCAKTAEKWIDVQRDEFKRLGVTGRWEKPYITMSHEYEVGILSAFRELVARGAIYSALKPVYWDAVYKTALAEAEIEYETITSPSIYVRYPAANPEKVKGLEGRDNLSVAIWTTTPWTLPASLAVSVHPNFTYLLVRCGDEHLIVAHDLLDAVKDACNLPEPEEVARYKGEELEGLLLRLPMFPERTGPVIVGDHVTLEQGTGCVHTAPGHGLEDYIVCQRYDIKPFTPVDENGNFTEDFPMMQGRFVRKCNDDIVAYLEEQGLLLKVEKIEHEYPHSWRSHQPVIYRATRQWFMDLNESGLRQQALDAIENNVQWLPQWGRERIWNMVNQRLEWCLSRQRSWGVPIPAMTSKKTGETLLDVALLDKVIEIVAEQGTDAWFELPASAFAPEGWTGPNGETADELEKQFDILDVWFDSGASHISVLEQDEELGWPCDLYLEGSDQHRGWFQSSLLVGVGARGGAPYRAVLTHGFLLDDKGEAMSKSKGNVVPPNEIVDNLGADVLRLWVVSEDYRADMRCSKHNGAIMRHVADTYRRVRNTIRFLLSNLKDYKDFDPRKDAVEYNDLEPLDQWALSELAKLIDQSRKAYDAFEFHRIYHLINRFCVVEMSAIYLDIVKDRLYCSGPTDSSRRAAQTVIHHILKSMVRLLAPILVFTAEEAWGYMQTEEDSVHLAGMPEAPDEWRNPELADRWTKILELREDVLKALEPLRKEKIIRHSLDAECCIVPKDDSTKAVLDDIGVVYFADLCIVSGVELVESFDAAEGLATHDGQRLQVQVRKAPHEKCARCWQLKPSVGQDASNPDLCERCAEVVMRCYA